jgi:hypothetical protein
MRGARSVGIGCLLLTASCAVVKPPAPAAPSAVASQPAAAPVVAPATPPPASIPSTPTEGSAIPVAPAVPPGAPPKAASTAPSAAKSREPAAKAPPAQAAKAETNAPVAAKPKAPTLDLESLEQRLKDTKAIGVLTKITLKNQVDDLLDQFRAFYQGKLKTTLAELRRSYELLFLKVIALLQDSDPALAGAIVASREAIWGILSDPAKFATI